MIPRESENEPLILQLVQSTTPLLVGMLLILGHAGIAAASFVPLEKHAKSGQMARPQSALQAIDCAGSVPVQVGDTVQGTTIGLTSNVDAYGCSTWYESGGEVIYSLSVPGLTSFEIRLNADCDLDVALLNSCDTGADCILVADTGIQTTTPVMGDYIVVVDGFEGAACDFTLEIIATDPWSLNPAACGTAIPLLCSIGPAISGDTCSGADHIRALGCETWRSAGKETWYRVTLAPTGSIAVDLAMPDGDAVLWILGGCASASECLDHSDSGVKGESESVSYTNDTGSNRTVYLVVDSYGAGTCGAWDGNVACDGFIVPNGVSSWSALKSRTAREEER